MDVLTLTEKHQILFLEPNMDRCIGRFVKKMFSLEGRSVRPTVVCIGRINNIVRRSSLGFLVVVHLLLFRFVSVCPSNYSRYGKCYYHTVYVVFYRDVIP